MNKTLKKTLAIILAALMLSVSATIAFAAEKKVVIEMSDSYGDGWNGNAIVISKIVDGNFVEVEKVTMNDESYENVEVELSASDAYVYEWQADMYFDECSFRLIIDGVIVLAVSETDAPPINEVLYVDCKHDIEGTECLRCGFTCATAPSHIFSAETGICPCGIECTHEFINTGFCKFCGVECSHEAYGDVLCTPAFVSGTSGFTFEEEASGLFDGNEDTKWCSSFIQSECPYFIFRYAVAVKLASYTLTTADDTGIYPERNWIDWTVYGSDSEDGEWTVVHEVQDAELPAGSFVESEVFEVNADTAYKYYKVVVNENGGEGAWGNSQQMAEFTPVTDPEVYYGCLTCGQEYKEPAEEETTEPDAPEDVAEICSFCGKEHANLVEEIICLFVEFFYLVKEAFRISM